jgi:putative heme-binding domain-containing protein
MMYPPFSRPTFPPMAARFLCVVITCCIGSAATSAPQVAPTDALSPDEQRAKFKLPPGFEIQLVVAEPQIGQPMNLNFDARGRLWITHSVEYPYPARGDVDPRSDRFAGGGENQPRDALTVVEGIGHDGKPKQVTRFVEGLNIPIGQTPLGAGDRAIVYSIPNIYLAADSDGDGLAESKQLLYGRFGNIDTHGMASSFTPWIDGWIYGCHGFSNTSEIKDASGGVTKMNSGNTYRFRADGSRFEQFTWGQVNPFGMTFDPLGNLYTSDCHSLPIYMMLRGAYYPSFGKPHDGLGFGPTMINHGHGSTGICGPAYYAADQFPSDYRDNIFICNPVNSVVHRDKLQVHGSTYTCDTQPDFVTCEDLWFRPVDAMVGPDGALYIADFYNAVIGHYEVPLNHPKRDRTHGRVWRIVYTGQNPDPAEPALPDLTKLDAPQLVGKLADANLLVRTLATNQLVERFPKTAATAVRGALKINSTPTQRAHGLWVLERLGALDDATIRSLAGDADRLVRVHLMTALAERPTWQSQHGEIVRAATHDDDAFVRRAAADALGQHPDAANFKPLLELLRSTPSEDTHLIHVARIALRNQLRGVTDASTVAALELSEREAASIAQAAAAVETPAAAALIVLYLKQQAPTVDADLARFVEHAAQHGDAATLEELATWVQCRYAADLDFQYRQLLSIHRGLEQRGEPSNATIRKWAVDLAAALLSADAGPSITWSNFPLPNAKHKDDPWAPQVRPCSDGKSDAELISSHPRGEQLTGVLRSDPFELPATLSFFMAGHDGPPGQPAEGKNLIQLRDAATGDVFADAHPPRNDMAQRFEWKLDTHKGRKGYLEVVDASEGTGYAWLAVGRFSLPALNQRSFAPQQAAAELAASLKLDELKPQLGELLTSAATNPAAKSAIARALVSLQPDSRVACLLPVIDQPNAADSLKSRIYAVVVDRNETSLQKTLEEVFRRAPQTEQQQLAAILATDQRGAAVLLDLIAKGHASPRLLMRAEIVQKLRTLKLDDAEKRIASLTAGLPSEDAALRDLIAKRRESYSLQSASASAARGLEVFKKTCAACHKVADQGATVGPQLDGIGARGADRLIEDILDPNRNVDPAFRTSSIILTDGRVLTGLFRQKAGAALVFADEKGKEFQIAASEIDELTKSPLSLMPANFADTIKRDEWPDLLAYLLSLQQGPEQKR